jgi:hypothetical protein
MPGYQHAYAVEFTVLDESRVVAYQVIVQNMGDADVAIAKAEAQFKSENADARLVPIDVIADPIQRGQMDRKTTWWRNRAAYSHQVLT